MKKVSNLAIKIAKWLAGSWWGVTLHAFWFGAWLVYDFDLGILTMAVSLEAIFIGIFLLMASDRAEEGRDRREMAAQKRATDIIEKILDLQTRVEKQQQQILRLLMEKEEKKQ